MQNAVYIGANRALLSTLDEVKMIVDTRDMLLTPYLLLDRVWEPAETELFRRLIRPGQTFVDVGANIGYYSLLAAKLGAGSVIAFEPDPKNFELLSRNVIINWLRSTIVTEQSAVSSEEGTLRLFCRNSYGGNSSIGEVSADHLRQLWDAQSEIVVRATSLDAYFQSGQRVDLVKIDVEGAEPLVFRGMNRFLADNPSLLILCEWSIGQMRDARQDPAELLEVWRQHRFSATSMSGEPVSFDALPGIDHIDLLLSPGLPA